MLKPHPPAVAAPGCHCYKMRRRVIPAAGAIAASIQQRQRMDYFAQQLINGIVLGSIYGLIAIGYTMVYGIVGMINFAHGDIFMTGGYTLLEKNGFIVRLSNVQIVVVITTVVLLAIFTWLVARTRLGRDMRACEQDQTMAALLGVDVDRTISMTFVIGAALAAVAGMMYLLYYGLVDFFMGFVAGIKAFTAAVLGGIGSLPGAMLGGLAIGLIETLWSAYFSAEFKAVAAFSILIIVLIFLPTRLLGRPEVDNV